MLVVKYNVFIYCKNITSIFFRPTILNYFAELIVLDDYFLHLARYHLKMNKIEKEFEGS